MNYKNSSKIAFFLTNVEDYNNIQTMPFKDIVADILVCCEDKYSNDIVKMVTSDLNEQLITFGSLTTTVVPNVFDFFSFINRNSKLVYIEYSKKGVVLLCDRKTEYMRTRTTIYTMFVFMFSFILCLFFVIVYKKNKI